MTNITQRDFQRWLIDNAAADPYETLSDFEADYESDTELFNEE